MSILRKHLIEKVAVSEICDKYEIAPSAFYKWQAQLFEQGEKVFEQSNNAEKVKPTHYEQKIQALEEKLVRKAEVLSKLMEEHIKLKKSWNELKGKWIEFDVRDEVIDFIKKWSAKTEIRILIIVAWIGISRSKYYDWESRYGLANEHNAKIPRDHWLEEQEKQAIVKFYKENPCEGYRRVTYRSQEKENRERKVERKRKSMENL